MRKKIIISLLVLTSFLPGLVFAAGRSPFVNSTGSESESSGFSKFFGTAIGDQTVGSDLAGGDDLLITLPIAIGRIINTLLSFVGIILLIVYVMAGFLWLTAGGKNDQVDKAKMYIKNATIGMTLALTVFSLTSLIVRFLEAAILKST